MRRILSIAFNLFVASMTPILCWFCIGAIFDSKLINTFSVTYPFQFVYSVLLEIFGTGANIQKQRDRNEAAVFSGFLIGTICTALIFGTAVLNIDSYLEFMGFEVNTYKDFGSFSLLHFGISVLFYALMEQLYFEDKEEAATKYCLIFNGIHFGCLVGISFVTLNAVVATVTTLVISILFISYVAIKTIKPTKLRFNVWKSIKYESSDICSSVLFLLIFLLGLKNVNTFAPEYMTAVNFVALITDTQWDATSAITTIAKVDIVKERLDFRKHLRDSYALVGSLLLTSVLMLILLATPYDVNVQLAVICFSFEFVNFLMYPFYAINNVMVQLKASAVTSTVIKFVANAIRFLLTLLPTPFCTGIGQIASALIHFIGYGLLGRKLRRCTNDVKVKDL